MQPSGGISGCARHQKRADKYSRLINREDCFRYACRYLTLPEIVRLSMVNENTHHSFSCDGLIVPCLDIGSRSYFLVPKELCGDEIPGPFHRCQSTDSSTCSTDTAEFMNGLTSNHETACRVRHSLVQASTYYDPLKKGPAPLNRAQRLRLCPANTTGRKVVGQSWRGRSILDEQKWLSRIIELRDLAVTVGGPDGISPSTLALILWNNRESLERIRITWEIARSSCRFADVSHLVDKWWSKATTFNQRTLNGVNPALENATQRSGSLAQSSDLSLARRSDSLALPRRSDLSSALRCSIQLRVVLPERRATGSGYSVTTSGMRGLRRHGPVPRWNSSASISSGPKLGTAASHNSRAYSRSRSATFNKGSEPVPAVSDPRLCPRDVENGTKEILFPRVTQLSIQLHKQYSSLFFERCRFPACSTLLIEEVNPFYERPSSTSSQEKRQPLVKLPLSQEARVLLGERIVVLDKLASFLEEANLVGWDPLKIVLRWLNTLDLNDGVSDEEYEAAANEVLSRAEQLSSDERQLKFARKLTSIARIAQKLRSEAKVFPDLIRFGGTHAPLCNGNHLQYWVPLLESCHHLTEAHLLLGDSRVEEAASDLRLVRHNLSQIFRCVLRRNSETLTMLSCRTPALLSHRIIEEIVFNRLLFPQLRSVDCEDALLVLSHFAVTILQLLPRLRWYCSNVLIGPQGPLPGRLATEPYRPADKSEAAVLDRFLLLLLQTQIKEIELCGFTEEFLSTFQPEQTARQVASFRRLQNEFQQCLDPAVYQKLDNWFSLASEACSTELSAMVSSGEQPRSSLVMSGARHSLSSTGSSRSSKMNGISSDVPVRHHRMGGRLISRMPTTNCGATGIGSAPPLQANNAPASFRAIPLPLALVQNILASLDLRNIDVIRTCVSELARFPLCMFLNVTGVSETSKESPDAEFYRGAVQFLRSTQLSSWLSAKGSHLTYTPRLRVTAGPGTPGALFALLPQFDLQCNSHVQQALVNLVRDKKACPQLKGLLGEVAELRASLACIKLHCKGRLTLTRLHIEIPHSLIRYLCTIDKIVPMLSSFPRVTEIAVSLRQIQKFLSPEEMFSPDSPDGYLMLQHLRQIRPRRHLSGEFEYFGLYRKPIFLFRCPRRQKRDLVRFALLQKWSVLTRNQGNSSDDEEVVDLHDCDQDCTGMAGFLHRLSKRLTTPSMAQFSMYTSRIAI